MNTINTINSMNSINTIGTNVQNSSFKGYVDVSVKNALRGYLDRDIARMHTVKDLKKINERNEFYIGLYSKLRDFMLKFHPNTKIFRCEPVDARLLGISNNYVQGFIGATPSEIDVHSTVCMPDYSICDDYLTMIVDEICSQDPKMIDNILFNKYIKEKVLNLNEVSSPDKIQSLKRHGFRDIRDNAKAFGVSKFGALRKYLTSFNEIADRKLEAYRTDKERNKLKAEINDYWDY